MSAATCAAKASTVRTEPALHPEGFHKVTLHLDERHNLIVQAHFDQREEPVPVDGFVALAPLFGPPDGNAAHTDGQLWGVAGLAADGAIEPFSLRIPLPLSPRVSGLHRSEIAGADDWSVLLRCWDFMLELTRGPQPR
jgi:hypothetical protein